MAVVSSVLCFLSISHHYTANHVIKNTLVWFAEWFGYVAIKFAQDHRCIVVYYIFRLTVTWLDSSMIE